MRRPVAVALLVVVATLVLSACSGSLRQTPGPRVHPIADGIGCGNAVRPSARLAVPVATASASPSPFGLAVTGDGRQVFVGGIGGVSLYALGGARPRFIRRFPFAGEAFGLSLTPSGRYLLAADGRDGAIVIDVGRALSGAPGALLGELSGGGGRVRSGAIEVTTSADGRFAFVSLANAGRIAVFDLDAALAGRFRRSAYAGSIPVGRSPVGLAVSPGGRWLYATSQGGLGPRAAGGLLSVIDIAAAERDPAGAVVARVGAGCSPVRVDVSADGRIVWVTARRSDRLLAFSAGRLRGDPRHALIASVLVGEEPVGVALVDAGRQVVVADSNRFEARDARAQLTVVGVRAALADRPAVLGTIASGLFPRELVLDPRDRVLLVSNYASNSLETVRLRDAP